MTEWTPAMDARLAELHTNGAKFKLIAQILSQEFKVELTRNAVIGRAHRQLLRPRRKSTVVQKDSVKKRRPRPRAVRDAPPIAPEPAPPIGRLLMRHLTRATCHWPYGDTPPYVYCGGPTHEGSSFCRKHYERAYVLPRNRS